MNAETVPSYQEAEPVSSLRQYTPRHPAEGTSGIRVTRILGCIHMALGTFVFVLSVVGRSQNSHSCRIRSGSWCGPYFIGFGLLLIFSQMASNKRTYFKIACGLCVLNGVLALILFITSIFDDCESSFIPPPSSIGFKAGTAILGSVEIMITLITANMICSFCGASAGGNVIGYKFMNSTNSTPQSGTIVRPTPAEQQPALPLGTIYPSEFMPPEINNSGQQLPNTYKGTPTVVSSTVIKPNSLFANSDSNNQHG